MEQSAQNGGVLGFLDGLVKTAVTASVAVAQVKSNLKGPSTADQTEVGGVSRLQTAAGSIPTLWLVLGGLGVVVVAAMLLRRK